MSGGLQSMKELDGIAVQNNDRLQTEPQQPRTGMGSVGNYYGQTRGQPSAERFGRQGATGGFANTDDNVDPAERSRQSNQARAAVAHPRSAPNQEQNRRAYGNSTMSNTAYFEEKNSTLKQSQLRSSVTGTNPSRERPSRLSQPAQAPLSSQRPSYQQNSQRTSASRFTPQAAAEEEEKSCCRACMRNLFCMCVPRVKTPELVDVGEAVQMVHHLKLSEVEKHWVLAVWVQKLRVYQGHLERAHFWRFLIRFVIYLSAVLILALSGAAYGAEATDRTSLAFVILFAVLNLLAVGIGNYMNMDMKIKNYYSTRSVLTKLGMDFLTLTGEFADYSTHAECVKRFVTTCNEITFNNTQSFVLVTSARRQGLAVAKEDAHRLPAQTVQRGPMQRGSAINRFSQQTL